MKFNKPRFSFGGHFETIWPKSYPQLTAEQQWTEKVIPLEADNEIKIKMTPLRTKVLIILHGLGGDWDTSENLWSARAAIDSGWCVAQVQWPRNPPSHAGQKEHLEAVLSYVENLGKFQKIYLLGFSMGASIMLNWARGQTLKRVQKLISVSAPLDLDRTSRKLKSGMCRIYDLRFNKILRSWYPKARIKAHMSIFEVDEFFTARTHGFKDREDYYRSCSALYFLDEIQIPQHYVVAANDPLIDIKDYRDLKPSLLRHVTITDGGGHVGYGPWMEKFILNQLK